MRSTKRSRSNPFGSSRGRLLTLLLVGTLLLCHGILWTLHLCSAPPVSVNQAYEHHWPPTQAGVGDHEHPGCHSMGATDYFAVLLTTFLGLVLGLLLKGARLCGSVARFEPFERSFRPLVLHPPRGPTTTLLQVFRL
jgi:hypothetical protein